MKELQQQNLERMKAIQEAAEGIIAAQLTDDLNKIAAYGGIAASYALIMLGYNGLRQYLAAPKARADFKVWAAFAKQDKVTTSCVPSKAPQDYRILANPARMLLVQRAAHEILAKHLTGRIPGCSLTQAIYIAIVLAYKTLRRDLNERAAARVFDLLALHALRDIDTGRARLSKLH